MRKWMKSSGQFNPHSKNPSKKGQGIHAKYGKGKELRRKTQHKGPLSRRRHRPLVLLPEEADDVTDTRVEVKHLTSSRDIPSSLVSASLSSSSSSSSSSSLPSSFSSSAISPSPTASPQASPKLSPQSATSPLLSGSRGTAKLRIPNGRRGVKRATRSPLVSPTCTPVNSGKRHLSSKRSPLYLQDEVTPESNPASSRVQRKSIPPMSLELPPLAALDESTDGDLKNTSSCMSPCTPVRTPVRTCSISDQRVKQLTDFSQILDHASIRPACLVALDIDETIVQTEGGPSLILTDDGVAEFQRWIRGRFPDFKTRNKWCRKLEQCLKTKSLVQTDTAEVIRELQAQGCWVFGLTARYSEMSAMTDKQLADVGVDLNAHSPFQGRCLMDPATKALLRNGIIYCNSQAKGVVLNRFLENVLFRSHLLDPNNSNLLPLPGGLVFVDDNYQHVLSVSRDLEILKKLPIPISCYHYVPEQERSRHQASDESDYLLGNEEKEKMAILETQMEVFVSEGIILTNGQARQRVEGHVWSDFFQTRYPDGSVKKFNCDPFAVPSARSGSPRAAPLPPPCSPAKKAKIHHSPSH